MEDFKKKFLGRQILIISGLLLTCSLVLLTRNLTKEVSTPEHLQGFIMGFQMGLVMVLIGAFGFFFARNIIAMHNPDMLKKLYISETDERKLFIMQKSGSIGMNIAMYGLAVGTTVAGNINDTVFFTLLGATLFVSLIRGAFKVYYRIKY